MLMTPQQAVPAEALAVDAPGAGAGVNTSVAKTPRYPERLALVIGLVVFVVAVGLAFLLSGIDRAITFTPPDGITAFALFFLAATVVERVLEPFSSALVRSQPQPATTESGSDSTTTAAPAAGRLSFLGKTKADALDRRTGLLAAAMGEGDDGTKTTQAAAEQATADQAVVNGTFVIWAFATLLAVMLSWYFALSLPTALGVSWTDPEALDKTVSLVITALVVGAGTKPLHDFFSNIQKDSQGQNASSGGSTGSS